MDDVLDQAIGPQPSSTGSAVDDFVGSLFGLATAKVQQDTVKAQTAATFNQAPQYGVNEQGNAFLAGKATFLSNGSIFGVPAPLVLVVVGILAAAFVLHHKG